MQKKLLLLFLLVCFSNRIVKSSSDGQPRMKMGEAFIHLLKDKRSKGKFIKELEADVFSRCTWSEISENLGKNITEDQYLRCKFPKNIAQMHALFRVQFFIKFCNQYAKSKGMPVQEEEYGDVFKGYVAIMERMNK